MNAMIFVVSYILWKYFDKMITISVIFIFYLGCSFGQPTKKCSSDICDSSVCTDHPNAVCFPDECANCSTRYFNENDEVTNVCGKLLLLCNKLKSIYNLVHLYILCTLSPNATVWARMIALAFVRMAVCLSVNC